MVVNLKFDAFKFSFLSYALVGTILTGILISKSSEPDFKDEFVAIGTIGSVINTIGMILAVKASSVGPLGPVNALSSVQTILFTIVQAIRLTMFPKTLEILAMFIGLIGALVLTIPDHIERLYRFLTC